MCGRERSRHNINPKDLIMTSLKVINGNNSSETLISPDDAFQRYEIYGQGGDDFIWGHFSDDSLFGGDGNDEILGFDGAARKPLLPFWELCTHVGDIWGLSWAALGA